MECRLSHQVLLIFVNGLFKTKIMAPENNYSTWFALKFPPDKSGNAGTPAKNQVADNRRFIQFLIGNSELVKCFRKKTFYNGNFIKNLPIFDEIWIFGPKFFPDKLFIKYNESAVSGFASQHKLFFLFLIPKCIPKYDFFLTSKSTPSYR